MMQAVMEVAHGVLNITAEISLAAIIVAGAVFIVGGLLAVARDVWKGGV